MKNSIEVNGKAYTWIFWDWLNTLYNPVTGEFFDWVEPFFEEYSGLNYALVTRAAYPEKRMEKMRSSSIANYFKEFITTGYDKSEDFQVLIDEYEIPKKEILVVGDNRSSEGDSAKQLDLDYLHISEFIDWWSKQS